DRHELDAQAPVPEAGPGDQIDLARAPRRLETLAAHHVGEAVLDPAVRAVDVAREDRLHPGPPEVLHELAAERAVAHPGLSRAGAAVERRLVHHHVQRAGPGLAEDAGPPGILATVPRQARQVVAGVVEHDEGGAADPEDVVRRPQL